MRLRGGCAQLASGPMGSRGFFSSAMLGVLKAGGAYVPLDPSHPAQRLKFVIEDARMPVIVTKRELVRFLPETAAKVICVDEVGRVIPNAPILADTKADGALGI